MAYFSEEQIRKARGTDLLTYLKKHEPAELVHISGNVFSTRQHDSLKISNGKWMWWSKGIGGASALDYLIKVRGIPFTQAVGIILQEEADEPLFFSSKKKKDPVKRLLLPDENEDANVIVRYLTGRGIDRKIIEYCIRERLIFESRPFHNCVFIGYDGKGEAKYASYRGTGVKKVVGNAAGSDKGYAFRLDFPGHAVHVFEGAIDLLSFATKEKAESGEWKKNPLLSLGGIYIPSENGAMKKLPAALSNMLERRPDIKEVVLHLDNDLAGRTASASIKELLKDSYHVRDEPPLIGKDYNDYLMYLKKVRWKGEKHDDSGRY